MTRIGRTVLAAVAAGVLSIAGALGVGAGSPGTVSITQHGDFTSSMLVPNPCTGNLVLLTLNSESVFHMTFFTAPGANEFWLTGTDVNKFTTSPDPVTGVTFSGQGADWFGANLNQSSATSGFTFTLEGTGTDGSHISAHFVRHITVTSFGPPPVITATVNDARTTCS